MSICILYFGHLNDLYVDIIVLQIVNLAMILHIYVYVMVHGRKTGGSEEKVGLSLCCKSASFRYFPVHDFEPFPSNHKSSNTSYNNAIQLTQHNSNTTIVSSVLITVMAQHCIDTILSTTCKDT